MLNFSNILGSSPLCCSRFTAVLNQGSFEQLSKNADVNAGNKNFIGAKLQERFSHETNQRKHRYLKIELN